MPKALKRYITNIDVVNEDVVITDAPKESFDVAILRMIVLSPPIDYILIGALFIFHIEN